MPPLSKTKRTKERSLEADSTLREPAPDNHNPLLNTLVLEQLFKFASFDDFSTWRLVCKQWWDASLPQWRRRVWINVSDNPTTPSDLSIQQYFKILDSPGDPFQLNKLPLRKFNIHEWSLDLMGRENKQRLQFWNRVGGSMTHLSCSNSLSNNKEDLARILFELTPNLEYLQLKRNSYKHLELHALRSGRLFRKWRYPYILNESGSNYPIKEKLTELEVSFNLDRMSEKLSFTWNEFLVHFPNVERLKLQNFCPSYPTLAHLEFENVIATIARLRQESGAHYFSHLMELDILNVRLKCLVTFAVTRDLFSQLRFPLTTLILDVGIESSSSGFKTLLELHSNTLKKVVAYQGPYVAAQQNFSHDIDVYLPELTHLKLIGPVCRNLRFLQFTPKLKSLLVIHSVANGTVLYEIEPTLELDLAQKDSSYAGGERLKCRSRVIKNTNFGELAGLVLPHMEELLVETGEMCLPNEVQWLSILMPNLKRLRLRVTCDAYTVAQSSWKLTSYNLFTGPAPVVRDVVVTHLSVLAQTLWNSKM
ncbi:unnamed protein product [Orchesella dallaii]|uniref:F-box domain-containing protein n=1 Tax=Orchesella dallaii TaxID=48710 RepID=A0ABP1RS36_9HEXA